MRWDDLPPEYRTALEPGAGRAPSRIIARRDAATGMTVHDVWDMRPAMERPARRPVLAEAGVLDWDDAMRAAEALTAPRIHFHVGGEVPRVR